ncbi:hypothetical protein E2C01_074595 [Portunus trituberculatus]|uniref:Uncharacterized protein n=1 Tax=Portunus trituberculatus TaxID=210409 RepID=A0A5B7I8F0_PORTR|nr:hypothetical protein [Portunus trituberculatus]
MVMTGERCAGRLSSMVVVVVVVWCIVSGRRDTVRVTSSCSRTSPIYANAVRVSRRRVGVACLAAAIRPSRRCC